MIGIICVLSTVVCAMNADLTSPFNDDWTFQDTNNVPSEQTVPLSFNQPASLFEQANLPEDPNFGLPSSSNALFHDSSSNDYFLSENDEDFFLSSLSDDGNDIGSSAVFDGSPSEIASCQSSTTLDEFPFAVDKKSRLRRQNGSNGICKPSNEATGAFSSSSGDELPDLSVPKKLFTDPYSILLLTGNMNDDRKNRFCYWFTQGLKPFGVCSSGEAGDAKMSMTSILTLPPFGQFGLWTLTHGTLGMFSIDSTLSIFFLKFMNPDSCVRLNDLPNDWKADFGLVYEGYSKRRSDNMSFYLPDALLLSIRAADWVYVFGW